MKTGIHADARLRIDKLAAESLELRNGRERCARACGAEATRPNDEAALYRTTPKGLAQQASQCLGLLLLTAHEAEKWHRDPRVRG